jgi:hypothetical protein
VSAGPGPGAVRSLSIDYSEDELDALADLFGLPALGSARLRRPPATGTEEAVLRATLATATRGLVARHAMMLSGTAIRPKVELLEPHATILRTFLGSTAVLAVEQQRRAEVDRRVLFVRDDVVVEQRAVGGRAILRMVAHPAGALDELAAGALDLSDEQPQAAGEPLEVVTATLDRGFDEAHAEAPGVLRDLLYARRRAIRATASRQTGTGVERTALEWLDAGDLGLWRVEREREGVTAMLAPTSAADARRELTLAYGAGRVAL